MNKDDIVIIVCLLALLLTFCYPKVKEGFQRMNYIQMHDYLNNEYGSGGVMRHGFGNNSSYFGSGSRSPSRSEYTRHHSRYNSNQPRLVGYIYSQDEDNNDTYQLFEMHDYKRGRPGYAYKDSKYQDNREAVLVNITHDLYDGEYLYDGDIITAGYDKQPFVVKLYEIKSVGLGTRYANKDYNDEMENYALLSPVDPGDGQIDEEDRYYILYRQSLDPSRNRYNYYIKDKRGTILELDQKYKDLDDGDKISIPGKEKLGLYVVNPHDRY